MNLNEGKKFFDNFLDAKKIAKKLSRENNRGFDVYKLDGQWAIGGIHMKKIDQRAKIKSFDDIRILLDKFKISEDDESVESYISDIQEESLSKKSDIYGEAGEWVLRSVDVRIGRDIGMSFGNESRYLVLSISNKKDNLEIKMGGKFGRHIELIKRQADGLVGSSIVWYTWNNNTSNWSSTSWFYRIESI